MIQQKQRDLQRFLLLGCGGISGGIIALLLCGSPQLILPVLTGTTVSVTVCSVGLKVTSSPTPDSEHSVTTSFFG